MVDGCSQHQKPQNWDNRFVVHVATHHFSKKERRGLAIFRKLHVCYIRCNDCFTQSMRKRFTSTLVYIIKYCMMYCTLCTSNNLLYACQDLTKTLKTISCIWVHVAAQISLVPRLSSPPVMIVYSMHAYRKPCIP